MMGDKYVPRLRTKYDAEIAKAKEKAADKAAADKDHHHVEGRPGLRREA